jgi:hypothetical protein
MHLLKPASPLPRQPYGVYGHYHRWCWLCLSLQYRSIPYGCVFDTERDGWPGVHRLQEDAWYDRPIAGVLLLRVVAAAAALHPPVQEASPYATPTDTGMGEIPPAAAFPFVVQGVEIEGGQQEAVGGADVQYPGNPFPSNNTAIWCRFHVSTSTSLRSQTERTQLTWHRTSTVVTVLSSRHYTTD